jgi:carbon-monoxide dehydrogenase large subunit
VAVSRASELVLSKAKRLAAFLLEAAEADIEHEGELFRIAGTDRSITWAQLAEAEIPGEPPGLDEELLYKRNTECNFPNGCHVAEVEVDPDTGEVAVVRYAAVDDVGVPLNPMLVHGQCHGGIVSGIGQALYEHAVYDADSGQLVTATFQDYCLPRAGDIPDLAVDLNVVPCPSNDLGVKGAGEGGSCGAPPAVVSAVCDALGVAHIDMPVTPEKVWRALSMRQAAE